MQGQLRTISPVLAHAGHFRFEGLLASARCVRAHSDDAPDLLAPSAALPTARTPPEPPFCRPPHPELQLPSSGASEPVDARFELAPLDDGQLERVEVARLQELKIGHLHRKRGHKRRRLCRKQSTRCCRRLLKLPMGDFRPLQV